MPLVPELNQDPQGNEEKPESSTPDPTVAQPTTLKQEIVHFTQRQIDILELKAQGLTNAEVGRRLKLSGVTIKNNLYAMYDEIGTNSPRKAVMMALSQGLLNTDKISENLDFGKYASLSAVERRTLDLLTQNPEEQRKDLARRRFVALPTHKNTAHEIYKKLGVANAIQAAVYRALLPEEIIAGTSSSKS